MKINIFIIFTDFTCYRDLSRPTDLAFLWAHMLNKTDPEDTVTTQTPGSISNRIEADGKIVIIFFIHYFLQSLMKTASFK